MLVAGTVEENPNILRPPGVIGEMMDRARHAGLIVVGVVNVPLFNSQHPTAKTNDPAVGVIAGGNRISVLATPPVEDWSSVCDPINSMNLIDQLVIDAAVKVADVSDAVVL